MQKRILLVFLVALLPFPVHAIDPDDMTDDDRALVSNTCKSAQRIMQRVQYVDPVARVNRGTTYGTISKLMTSLSARAAYNAYSIPQLGIETDTIQDLRVQFAKDYTDYEIALRNSIGEDCAKDPEGFYKRLVDVRTKRSIVALRIREMDQHLDTFNDSVLQLENLVKLKDRQ